MRAASAPKGHSPNELEKLKMEYEQVNTNFRMLADIRFKLLALVPTLGGAAVYVLSKIVTDKQVGESEYLVAFLISLIGFAATLGILFYDQRNTELYNALIGRATDLEKLLNFQQRPPRGRFLFNRFSMGHDAGLAMIYGPVLGAWFFPIAYAGHSFLQMVLWHRGNPLYVALGIAVSMAAVFTWELARLDESAPGQRIIQVGHIVRFDPTTGELGLSFCARNMSRSFEGTLSRDCKQKMGQRISQMVKGRELKIHYKKKWEWKKEREEWESHKEITQVVFLPHKVVT
jgi:hypothetical protein